MGLRTMRVAAHAEDKPISVRPSRGLAAQRGPGWSPHRPRLQPVRGHGLDERSVPARCRVRVAAASLALDRGAARRSAGRARRGPRRAGGTAHRAGPRDASRLCRGACTGTGSATDHSGPRGEPGGRCPRQDAERSTATRCRSRGTPGHVRPGAGDGSRAVRAGVAMDLRQGTAARLDDRRGSGAELPRSARHGIPAAAGRDREGLAGPWRVAGRAAFPSPRRTPDDGRQPLVAEVRTGPRTARRG